jgi:predicted anti-sigma-YlaC factor YlaD
MPDHADKDGCRHLLGDLSDFLEGEAPAEIEEHMDGCEDCRVVVDTLGKTISLYRTAPQPDLPEGARQRLYKALDLDAFIAKY